MKKIIFISLLSFLVFSGAACQKTYYDLGIYKSDDAGVSWQQKIKIGKKKALATQEVLALTLDPQNSDIIFAGTKGKGIFKSIDGAESWQKTSIAQGEITSIVIDPKDSNIIYVANYIGEFGKIYKSEDGGNNFSEIYSETHSTIPVFALAVDWYDTRKIWAGTKKGAILKSDDSGRNWVVKKWLQDEIMQIAISSKDSRHIVVGMRASGLWETEDGGNNWKQINDTFLAGKSGVLNSQKLQVHQLIFDKKGTLYFASKYQLLKSKNEGKTWKEINLLTRPGEASLMRAAIDPFDPNVIYVGLDSNIYKSEDRGKNWKVKKITSGRIAALSINPNDSNKIYVGIRKPKE